MIKFSVLMSVYKNDDPVYFEEAIESILHQSMSPNEIVIVKDGPLPKELDKVIEKYEVNTLFKIISLSENSGLGIALQKGLLECKYDLVARMDSDDIAMFTRFQDQLDCFVKDKNLAIVGSDIAEFIENVENIVSYRKVPYTDFQIKKAMKSRCPFNHMTVMFKKDEVLKVGNYMDWHFNEDYFLWIRLLEKNVKMKNLDKILVYARVNSGMYERRGGTKYFLSEKRLQQYMLKKGIINNFTYICNVIKRYMLEILLPSKMRKWIYINIIRKTSI